MKTYLCTDKDLLPGDVFEEWLSDAEGTLHNIAAALAKDGRDTIAERVEAMADELGTICLEVRP